MDLKEEIKYLKGKITKLEQNTTLKNINTSLREKITTLESEKESNNRESITL